MAFANPANAQPEPYAFDRSHSKLFFDWVHQGYSVMIGRFTNFGGEFLFDPAEPTASQLDITIDAASVDVYNDELNPRLRGEEFFNAAEYPEIHFVSRRIERIDSNRLRVHGEITMLGVTRPLELDVTRNKVAVNRQGLMVAGFSGRGRLTRSDFGMDFLAQVAGGEIAFRVEVEASPKAAMD
jgi:polyisoprenoid-binding protein YceI